MGAGVGPREHTGEVERPRASRRRRQRLFSRSLGDGCEHPSKHLAQFGDPPRLREHVVEAVLADEALDREYPGMVDLTELFDYPTIAELAGHLESKLGG